MLHNQYLPSKNIFGRLWRYFWVSKAIEKFLGKHPFTARLQT